MRRGKPCNPIPRTDAGSQGSGTIAGVARVGAIQTAGAGIAAVKRIGVASAARRGRKRKVLLEVDSTGGGTGSKAPSSVFIAPSVGGSALFVRGGGLNTGRQNGDKNQAENAQNLHFGGSKERFSWV